MPDKKSDTLIVLEKKLLKNGKAACPNPECKGSIVSEESQGRAGSNILEYWCENEACRYHKKRVINISIGNSWIEEIKRAFSSLGKKAIAGVVGFLILFATSVGSNVKSFFFGEETEDTTKEMLEKNEILERKIATLTKQIEAQDNTGGVPETVEDTQKIKRLEQKVDSLKNLLNNQPKYSLEDMVAVARNRITSDDPENAKKIFRQFYSDDQLRNDLLNQNPKLRIKMVDLIAGSYSEELKWFPTQYFEDSTEFKFFVDFLNTFQGPREDKYLAKAFYNYPNYNFNLSDSESKRYQLMALKHYLIAAKNKSFTHENVQVIKEINSLLDLYKLFEKKPGLDLEGYVTIHTAIKEGKTQILNQRIKTLQKIIDNIF